MKDLIVLAADKSMKLVMDGLLTRSAELGLRAVSFDAVVHEKRDPGVRLEAHSFLHSQLRRYGHALAICDRHGSGQARSRQEIEDRIEGNISVNGWNDRAAAIVIDPELENWMWGDWRATSQALTWSDARTLRQLLVDGNLLRVEDAKPCDPKAALESAARCCGKRWSSSIHQEIAGRARIESCIDPAFLKLRSVLQRWFPLAT